MTEAFNHAEQLIFGMGRKILWTVICTHCPFVLMTHDALNLFFAVWVFSTAEGSRRGPPGGRATTAPTRRRRQPPGLNGEF